MRKIIPLSILPCALAALLVAEIVRPIVPPPDLPTPSAVRPTQPVPTAPVADVRIDDLVATVLDRPLMDPNRRARGIAPVALVGSDELPRLSGVIIGPDGKRAIFASVSGRPQVLAEGDHVGQTVIKTILPDEVILAGSEGEQVIRLRHSPTMPTTSTPRGGSGK